jgi:hypothetical protein
MIAQRACSSRAPRIWLFLLGVFGLFVGLVLMNWREMIAGSWNLDLAGLRIVAFGVLTICGLYVLSWKEADIKATYGPEYDSTGTWSCAILGAILMAGELLCEEQRRIFTLSEFSLMRFIFWAGCALLVYGWWAKICQDTEHRKYYPDGFFGGRRDCCKS